MKDRLWKIEKILENDYGCDWPYPDKKSLKEYLDSIDLIHKYAFLDMKNAVFTPEFRKYCEENACGNYGKNYSCPPYCGTPEEMEEKARKYPAFLLIQTRWEVDDCMDPQASALAKKAHNAMSFEIIEKFKSLGVPLDAMMAGPCSECRTGCMMTTGIPCKRNYEIYSCASAYCFNIAEAAKAAGMECWGEKNRINLFTVIMMPELL